MTARRTDRGSRWLRPAGFLTLLCLGLAAAGIATSAAAPSPSPSPSASTAPPDRGQALYAGGCSFCHGDQGQGTQQGPSIADAGAAGADYWLSTGRMPARKATGTPPRQPPAFSPSDIAALDQYVASLGSGPALPALQAGSVEGGRSVFLDDCAACHSSSGTGAAQVAGRAAPALWRATPQQVADAVRSGPGLMPAFPTSTVSDQQLDDLVSYIEYLRQQKAAGGDPLAGVGPVAETALGLVVFLIVVAACRIVVRIAA